MLLLHHQLLLMTIAVYNTETAVLVRCSRAISMSIVLLLLIFIINHQANACISLLLRGVLLKARGRSHGCGLFGHSSRLRKDLLADQSLVGLAARYMITIVCIAGLLTRRRLCLVILVVSRRTTR